MNFAIHTEMKGLMWNYIGVLFLATANALPLANTTANNKFTSSPVSNFVAPSSSLSLRATKKSTLVSNPINSIRQTTTTFISRNNLMTEIKSSYSQKATNMKITPSIRNSTLLIQPSRSSKVIASTSSQKKAFFQATSSLTLDATTSKSKLPLSQLSKFITIGYPSSFSTTKKSTTVPNPNNFKEVTAVFASSNNFKTEIKSYYYRKMTTIEMSSISTMNRKSTLLIQPSRSISNAFATPSIYKGALFKANSNFLSLAVTSANFPSGQVLNIIPASYTPSLSVTKKSVLNSSISEKLAIESSTSLNNLKTKISLNYSQSLLNMNITFNIPSTILPSKTGISISKVVVTTSISSFFNNSSFRNSSLRTELVTTNITQMTLSIAPNTSNLQRVSNTISASVPLLNFQIGLSVVNSMTAFLPMTFPKIIAINNMNSETMVAVEFNIYNGTSLTERFVICEANENFCQNRGICFKSATMRFCRCIGDYVGLFCETKGMTGMGSIVFWLGTLCGGLSLLLIISIWFVHRKLNKEEKEKKKLEEQLGSVKNQHNKLIQKIESQNKGQSFITNDFNYYTLFLSGQAKQSITDLSVRKSITSEILDTDEEHGNLTVTRDVADCKAQGKVGIDGCVEKQNAIDLVENDRVLNEVVKNRKTSLIASIHPPPPPPPPFGMRSIADLKMYTLNNAYDPRFRVKSKSLESLNNLGLNPLSKEFLRNKSNESIYSGTIVSNRKFSDATFNKKKPKGIWAQQQDRAKEGVYYF